MHENTLIVRAVIPGLNAHALHREELLRHQAEAAGRRRLRRRARIRAAWHTVAAPLNRGAADWRGRAQFETGGE
jgi:hypothetical protein